jgi:hypothetical protein
MLLSVEARHAGPLSPLVIRLPTERFWKRQRTRTAHRAGGVDLNGITLQASVDFAPAIGDQFMIVGNDFFDEIAFGGDGNDVVLTKTPEVLSTHFDHRTPVSRLGTLALADERPAFRPPVHHQRQRNESTGWSPVAENPVVSGTNRV